MRIWPRNAFSIVATIVVSSASAADPLLLLNGAGVAQVAGVPSAGPVHYLSGDIPQTANVIAVQLDGTLLIATIDPNAGGGFFGDTRLLRLDQNGVITQQAAFPNRNCVSMTIAPNGEPLLLLTGAGVAQVAGVPSAGPVHYLSGDIPQTANVIAVQLDGTLLIATIDPNAGGGFFGDTRLLRLDQNGVITQQAAFPNRNCVSMTTPSLLRGIDISKSAGEPTVSDFTKIRNQGYQFVIAAGWGGITANGHAETQLSRARSAGLFTAGYCYINFASAYDGARQIRNAL